MALEQEKTRLIILGAGASVDCGFYPTGAQLIELAKKVISFCDDLKDIEHLQNFITIKAKPYLQNLIDSNHSSIDSHISYIQNEDEQKFLKSFILSSIIACTAYSDLIGNFDKSAQDAFEAICNKIFHVYGSASSALDLTEKTTLKKEEEFDFNYYVKSWKQYYKKRASKYCLLKNNGKSTNRSSSGRHEVGEIKRYVRDSEEHKTLLTYDFEEGNDEDFPELDRNEKAFFSSFDIFLKHEKNYQTDCFIYLIIDDSLSLLSKKANDNNLSINRIKVIGEERGKVQKEIDIILDKNVSAPEPLINTFNFNYIYILGYGFDTQNNKVIKLQDIGWKDGCFVTNYGDNEKIERIIYEELSQEIKYDFYLCDPKDDEYSRDYINDSEYKEFAVPILSNKTVKGSLDNKFSLIEETSPIKIKTNLTPYLEMKKSFLANKQNN